MEEMVCLQSAGYITKEAILQKLTFIVLMQKMYVTVHVGCLFTSLQPRACYVRLLFLMFQFIKQGTQRKAIIDSFMAAQKYCLLATCRRRFLLQYFGEELNSDCGILFFFLK